jgi:hypothetical protein
MMYAKLLIVEQPMFSQRFSHGGQDEMTDIMS